MSRNKNKEMIKLLGEHVYDRRKELIERILEHRTRHLTVVLENIYQSHNASAVMRSAEIYGIQDVYVVEKNNQFEMAKGIVKGANKWIDVHQYKKEKTSLDCLNDLRAKGYKIIATAPGLDSANLEDYDITQKTAIVMGEEQNGVSADIMNNADGFLKIPMYGMTESFNISVATSIILYSLTKRLHQLPKDLWQLSEDEKDEKRLEWYKASVRSSKDLVRYYEQNLES